MNRPDEPQSQTVARHAVLLVLAVLVVFSPVVTFGFVDWDDVTHVLQNPAYHPPTITKLLAFWAHPYIEIYMPVTFTAWGALAGVAGAPMGALPFHLANLACHAAATLCVYGILRRLELAKTAALLGALIFAVHPIQVEPVAWVTGLKDVLSGALSLAAIYLYLRSTRAAYLAGTLAFALAVLSKPAAVTVPLVVIAIDLLARGRSWRSLGRAGVWLGVAIVGATLAKLAQPGTTTLPAPLWSRPFIAGDALAFYLSQILFPLRLGIDYGRSPHWLLHRPELFLNWLVPVTAIAIAWWYRGRWRWGIVGLAVLVAATLPVLGFATFDFQQYSTVADRYVYLGMLGAAIVVAGLIEKYGRRATQIAAVLLALFAVRTFVQTWTWSSSARLFENAIAVNPESAVAHQKIGGVLAKNAKGNPEVLREAAAHFEIALRANPVSFPAHFDLGTTLMLLGRYPEAADHYRQATRLRVDESTLSNLAEALRRGGQRAEAQAVLNDAVARFPRSASLHLQYGLLLREVGDDVAATQHLNEARRLDPRLRTD